MPIMLPVVDLARVAREVAVQAFQFVDGFTNCFTPTSGTLTGVLGLAGIPYGKYAKWYLLLVLLQVLLGAVVITLMQTSSM